MKTRSRLPGRDFVAHTCTLLGICLSFLWWRLRLVANVRGRRPDWLRVKLPYGETYRKLVRLIDENQLHTVCQSARCPNMGECWTAGTATFMILGNVCTRSCGFCAVKTGPSGSGAGLR